MQKICQKYVTNYFICCKFKVYNIQKLKLLISFSIFEKKRSNFSINVIVNFSKCCRKNRIFETILIVVNKLIKKNSTRSMKSINTKNWLKILHRKIFNCYELSKSIIRLIALGRVLALYPRIDRVGLGTILWNPTQEQGPRRKPNPRIGFFILEL